MDYEKLFIDVVESFTAKLNDELLAYDAACRAKGSASYNAAKALGKVKSTESAIKILTRHMENNA